MMGFAILFFVIFAALMVLHVLDNLNAISNLCYSIHFCWTLYSSFKSSDDVMYFSIMLIQKNIDMVVH